MLTIEKMREDALRFFLKGVEAADPAGAVGRALGKENLDLAGGGRIYVIGVGKAACRMVGKALELLPEASIASAIAVTNYENVSDIPHCEVLGAAHPLPDENGLQASHRIIEILKSTTARDIVLVLISGGGSALLPCPPAGVSLADKIAVTESLLKSGADITEMNTIRQQLSQLKGGGLVRQAYPSRVVSLILSDVPGDDLQAIASGPTVKPSRGALDAKAILDRYGLWGAIPVPARQAIENRISETDRDDEHLFESVRNILVGSNRMSLDAAMSAAWESYDVDVGNYWLDGNVSDAAGVITDRAEQSMPSDSPKAIFYGGETTVIVAGDGQGGRNQELSLRFSLLAESKQFSDDWVFLSGGTDGRDGPTDAAGGLVDSQTLARMRERGVDPQKMLSNNDSYAALAVSGDLLMTGNTGTNVADLQILLIRPGP